MIFIIRRLAHVVREPNLSWITKPLSSRPGWREEAALFCSADKQLGYFMYCITHNTWPSYFSYVVARHLVSVTFS